MTIPAQEALKRASTQLALWGVSDTKLTAEMRRELSRFFASAKIRVLGKRGSEARNVFTVVILFSTGELAPRVAGASLHRSTRNLYAHKRELLETNAWRFRPQAFSAMTRDEIFQRLAGTVNTLAPTGFELAQTALWLREIPEGHHEKLKCRMTDVAAGESTIGLVIADFRDCGVRLSDPVFAF